MDKPEVNVIETLKEMLQEADKERYSYFTLATYLERAGHPAGARKNEDDATRCMERYTALSAAISRLKELEKAMVVRGLVTWSASEKDYCLVSANPSNDIAVSDIFDRFHGKDVILTIEKVRG